MKNIKKKPLIIEITDIRLHSSKSNNPQSLERKLEKSIKNKKIERYYGGKFQLGEDGTLGFHVPLPRKLKGRDIIFVIPNTGLSIYPGKDSAEKIGSLKKPDKI